MRRGSQTAVMVVVVVGLLNGGCFGYCRQRAGEFEAAAAIRALEMGAGGLAGAGGMTYFFAGLGGTEEDAETGKNLAVAGAALFLLAEIWDCSAPSPKHRARPGRRWGFAVAPTAVRATYTF